MAWSYQRDLPLCAVAAGFPGTDDGDGHALALYESRTGWCSELTALHPSSGKRADASNPDMRPGVQLLADGSYVTATGADYLEVWRSDLVRTLEYGDVPTPVQPGKQPRPNCSYGSTAVSSDRIGVIERCPDAAADRLTVLTPDGTKGADTPDVQFSVELPAAGAVLVALSGDRVAVALPNRRRLLVLDQAGLQVTQAALDVPDAALATAPAGAPATVTTDGSRVYWWAGGTTVALDAARSRPPGRCATRSVRRSRTAPASWRRSATASPISTPRAARSCARSPCPAPTRRRRPVAAAGEVLLEQRGTEVVALRPAVGPSDEPLHGQHRHDRHDHAQRGHAPRGPGVRSAYTCSDHAPDRRSGVHEQRAPHRGPASLPAARPPTPRPGPRPARPFPPRAHRTARATPPGGRPMPAPARSRLAHGISWAHGVPPAPRRALGQWRRTSQDPHRGAGRAGKRASGSAPAARSSAAAASSAAERSAAATCPASDARSCRHAATCPLGKWCSSTSVQRRRSVRSAATA